MKKTILKEKLMEAMKSVLPVSAIVMVLCFSVSPITISSFTSFLFGTAFLIFGVALFTLGADMSMLKMGEYIGSEMTKSKKIWLIIILSFVVGCLITISEPDLQVLAKYAPSIDKTVLILSVSCGVGVFLIFAIMRIILGIRLKYLLLAFYGLTFILAFFVPTVFWAIAFDAGGVTTGPMTVPFIMALGVGISSIRSDSKETNDNFGLISLCSIGPIVSVLLLGLLYGSEGGAGEVFNLEQMQNSRELGLSYIKSIPTYAFDVFKAVFPILVFFIVYQLFNTRLSKKNLIRILIGITYTSIGLILFLTGANVGFMPAGYLIGEYIADSDFGFLIVPIGMIIGFFIVAAEPAVQVLEKQVEEETSGAIPRKALRFAMEVGVGISVGISMLRIITGLSVVYPIAIGYAIALTLTFFVPDTFTSIAFDSGGVASGTMTATFMLAFAIGSCKAVGGNIITDAFGLVAMVAMTPLIAIQVLGIVYKVRMRSVKAVKKEAEEKEIMEFTSTFSAIPAIKDDFNIEEYEKSVKESAQLFYDTEIIEFDI